MNHEEVDPGTPPDFKHEFEDQRDDFSSSGDRVMLSNYILIESSPDFKHEIEDQTDDFSSSGDRVMISISNISIDYTLTIP